MTEHASRLLPSIGSQQLGLFTQLRLHAGGLHAQNIGSSCLLTAQALPGQQVENVTELLRELQMLRVTREVQAGISRGEPGGGAHLHPASHDLLTLEAKSKHNDRCSYVVYSVQTYSLIGKHMPLTHHKAAFCGATPTCSLIPWGEGLKNLTLNPKQQPHLIVTCVLLHVTCSHKGMCKGSDSCSWCRYHRTYSGHLVP